MKNDEDASVRAIRDLIEIDDASGARRRLNGLGPTRHPLQPVSCSN